MPSHLIIITNLKKDRLIKEYCVSVKYEKQLETEVSIIVK